MNIAAGRRNADIENKQAVDMKFQKSAVLEGQYQKSVARRG
jgi:hypothetical protein